MTGASASADRTSSSFPDGIRDENLPSRRSLARHASPLSIAILGAWLALAMTGLLGGAPKPTFVDDAPAARLAVDAPAVVRNGELLEFRITVTPKRPIADLAIGVSPAYWRDITINTMIPAAAEEGHEQGLFRFDFGSAEPGKPLVVKVDGQINPSLLWGNEGRVIAYDGEAPIAAVPLTLRVLP